MAADAKIARPSRWLRFRESLFRSWPSAVSAGLLLLAFPPFNLGLLVCVALVPWFLSLSTLSGKQAWRSGYCFGFLYGMGQLLWLGQLVAHWVGSAFAAGVIWLLACAIFALYFGWLGVLLRHAWHRGWFWAIPVIWAGLEVVRAYIPLFAFPWGILATPLWPYAALIQHAHFGTIFLVSAWVALVNLTLALFMRRNDYAVLRPYAATCFAGACLSVIALGSKPPSTPTRVTVIQPGVDLAFGNQDRAESDLADRITPMLRDAASKASRLAVLPEGVSVAASIPPTTSFDIPAGLPVIFGGRRGIKPAYQSAFSFDGRNWKWVDKTRLVIFGEFVPGRDLFPFLAQSLRLPTGDMDAGQKGVQAMDVNGLQVGPIICFEALFPDIGFRQELNGARMLAVIGIDDWFMDSNAPDQLRAASVWRAVETGLPLVRSTTLGYTLACDGQGHILSQAPLREPKSLTVDLPVPNEPPVFRAAPVFPIASCLFTLAMPWLRPRKSKRAKV